MSPGLHCCACDRLLRGEPDADGMVTCGAWLADEQRECGARQWVKPADREALTAPQTPQHVPHYTDERCED